jgi:soluble lytic murein transglycosylase-like protein
MSQGAFWRAFLVAAAFVAAVPAARADYAVLRNGQRLHVTGYERRGSEIILQLAGGETTVPASVVLRFEPEDIFPAAKPAPAPGPFGAIVAKAAKQNELDRELLSSVIRAESDFHPRAVSPKGALGLMQLMPATARRLAVRDPFDPAENIQGGARYLKSLLGKFGTLNLALAAYNAGPGNVSLYGGVPPFRETHDYIARVRRDMKKKRGAESTPGLVKMICSPFEPRCREESPTTVESSRFPLP